MPRPWRNAEVALESTEVLATMNPWSWPVMKTLEGVFSSACGPLAATLFDKFHACVAVFAYTSPDDGGSWLQVSHSGPATAQAIATYAAHVCVDPRDTPLHALTTLSVKVEPRRDAISVTMTPESAAHDGCATLVECFYRAFVLRHLAFMRGTLPPPGQGIVLTYGLDRMLIEHVHGPAQSSAPAAQCLWIDAVPKSQRIPMD